MARLRALAAILLVVCCVQFWTIGSASATDCPNESEVTDGPHEFWEPNGNDAVGYRAPLELKEDGALCVGAGESAFAATWIGLEPAFQKGPVDQIGLLHMINPMTGFNEYCKWYAHDYPPKIHAYGCALTAETYYYFRVTEHGSSTSAAYYITDCGTSSSYSNCTDKYITDSVWENTYGVDMEEVDYGPDCQSRAMGTPGDPANIGTDANPIEGDRPGGMWSTRDLLYFYQVSATCGHYDYNSTTIPSTDQHTKMGYYDDRN